MMENIINSNIQKIVELIDKMIPVEWEQAKLLGQVGEGRTSVSSAFYFVELNQKASIRCYEISKRYGVNEELCSQFLSEVNACVLAIYDAMECEKKWDWMVLTITKQGKLDIDFRYNQMKLYDLLPMQRELVWAYEECNYMPNNPVLKNKLLEGLEIKKSFEKGKKASENNEKKDVVLKKAPQQINLAKNVSIKTKSPEQFVASIKKYLPDIDSRLEKVDIEKVNILEKMIDEQVNKCNNEIFELYQYINGEKIETVTLLMGGFTFLTIQQVIEEYKYFKSLDIILEECFSNCVSHYAIKKLCWIPFAYDSSNCYFAVDMTPGENGKIGQVIGIDLEYRKVYVLADSLNRFLGRLIGYMENGLCAVQQEGDDVFINAKSGHFFNSIEEMLS